jgi:aminoglycoside phosphotransferase (APT) family kinase protein
MLDRSYSIWERVHGTSLGSLHNKHSLKDAWIHVGYELGKLHTSIKDCDDPNGWLDSPDREYSKKEMMEYFGNRDGCARKVLEYIEYAFTERTFSYDTRFVHGDMHDENIMCSENGGFSALIDWGDAGWADPAIDFYMLPVWATGWALKGYAAIAPGLVNENFLNRIILDKIWAFVEEEKKDTEIYEGIARLKSDIGTGMDFVK